MHTVDSIVNDVRKMEANGSTRDQRDTLRAHMAGMTATSLKAVHVALWGAAVGRSHEKLSDVVMAYVATAERDRVRVAGILAS